MWEEILKAALSNGLWAVLFCVLLMYQLRDGKTREEKYRQTINTLLNRLDALDGVRKCVTEISATVTETLSLVKKKTKKEKSEREPIGEVLRV